MKKFFLALLLTCLTTVGCASLQPKMDLTTRHVIENENVVYCYEGDFDPMTIGSDYDYLRKDGEIVYIPGGGYYIVGMVAKNPDARVQQLLAIATMNGFMAYAFYYNGEWQCYHFDYDEHGRGCFVKDIMTEKDQENVQKMYEQIFQTTNV